MILETSTVNNAAANPMRTVYYFVPSKNHKNSFKKAFSKTGT